MNIEIASAACGSSSHELTRFFAIPVASETFQVPQMTRESLNF